MDMVVQRRDGLRRLRDHDDDDDDESYSQVNTQTNISSQTVFMISGMHYRAQ